MTSTFLLAIGAVGIWFSMCLMFIGITTRRGIDLVMAGGLGMFLFGASGFILDLGLKFIS